MSDLTDTAPPARAPNAAHARASRSPVTWVLTLYFAQGLPYFVVTSITLLLFKEMGLDNTAAAAWASSLGAAWVFKPLWSPFLEIFASKKKIVVAFQLVGAACMGLVALALQTHDSFALVMTGLMLAAFGSATHDIASDGLYIASLSDRQQALFAGWQGASFNIGRLVAKSGIPVFVGLLAATMGALHAWSLAFAAVACTMAAAAAYHAWALPDTRTGTSGAHSASQVARTLWEVLADFFRKPGIWFSIVFILLFRAGEGQLQTIGILFLPDRREAGGLGLTLAEIGTAYGLWATVAFVAGSVVGGYFTSWLGLRRAMAWLILVMNVPNLVYWWLSSAQPTDLAVIGTVLSLEMFGYGFGFVGIILYIMKVVATGRYTTAHYALGTGVMQLGMMFFGFVSGKIESLIGYQHFFVWTLLCAVPVFVLSFFLPHRDDGAPAA